RRHTRSTRDWSSDVCSSDLRSSSPSPPPRPAPTCAWSTTACLPARHPSTPPAGTTSCPGSPSPPPEPTPAPTPGTRPPNRHGRTLPPGAWTVDAAVAGVTGLEMFSLGLGQLLELLGEEPPVCF